MKKNAIVALSAVLVAAGIVVSGCGAATIDTVKQNEKEIITTLKEQAVSGSNSAFKDCQINVTVNDEKLVNIDNQKADSEYNNGTYRFSYDSDYFTVYEDAKDDMVTVSFYKDGFQMAGSNVITITELENTDCETVIEKYMDRHNAADDEMITNYIAGEDKPGCTYSTGVLRAEGSELTTSDTYYAVPNGKNVILIDEFRTLGPDYDENELVIDCEMLSVLDSFELVQK